MTTNNLSISKAQQQLAQAEATLDHYNSQTNQDGGAIDAAARAVVLRRLRLVQAIAENGQPVLDTLPLRKDDAKGTRELFWPDFK